MTQPPRRNEKVVERYTIILFGVVDVIELSCIFIGFEPKSFEELRGVDRIRGIRINTTPRIEPLDPLVFFELEVDEGSIRAAAEVIIFRS